MLRQLRNIRRDPPRFVDQNPSYGTHRKTPIGRYDSLVGLGDSKDGFLIFLPLLASTTCMGRAGMRGTYGGQGKAVAVDPPAALLCLSLSTRAAGSGAAPIPEGGCRPKPNRSIQARS
jgi:hypothetical protein